MTRVSTFDNANRGILAATSTASVCPTSKSETRIDTALLVSALFLQRFTLPFGKTYLALDLLPTAFILLHQFLSGKLVIQYDRFFWFIAAGLAATCSLLLNFESASLTSYLLFLVLCSLLTLRRPSDPDRYRSTLQAFQFLVMLLSCLSIAQFVAQFVVNGYQLIMFYGVVPDIFLNGGSHTVHPIEGYSLLKSNAIFLAEPSCVTQVAALGILIEVLEFRRPRYLLVMLMGSLFAYSGAGFVSLILFLPLASLRHSKVALSVMLVGMITVALFATGIIDYSAFQMRSAEFDQPGSSGFGHFVGGYWLVARMFDTRPLEVLLIGNGPGTKTLLEEGISYGGSVGWLKQLFEYGIIGSFVFICFLVSCVSRSRCPKLVIAAVIFEQFFITDFLATWVSTIMIVLCTSHGPEPRDGGVGQASRYEASFVGRSAAG